MIRFGMGPSSTHNNDSVLLQIIRTEGHKESGETTWAKPLGGDLYEIEGPLHLITGVNSGDVVKAKTVQDDSPPVVFEVVSRSGYTTLHILFSSDVPFTDRETVLQTLKKWGATHQMPFDRFYTIEISPLGDSLAANDYLKSLTLEGLLAYEPDIDMNSLLRLRFAGSDW